jgi:hypothetical protein
MTCDSCVIVAALLVAMITSYFLAIYNYVGHEDCHHISSEDEQKSLKA